MLSINFQLPALIICPGLVKKIVVLTCQMIKWTDVQKYDRSKNIRYECPHCKDKNYISGYKKKIIKNCVCFGPYIKAYPRGCQSQIYSSQALFCLGMKLGKELF